jgi:hypothetical protein
MKIQEISVKRLISTNLHEKIVMALGIVILVIYRQKLNTIITSVTDVLIGGVVEQIALSQKSFAQIAKNL